LPCDVGLFFAVQNAFGACPTGIDALIFADAPDLGPDVESLRVTLFHSGIASEAFPMPPRSCSESARLDRRRKVLEITFENRHVSAGEAHPLVGRLVTRTKFAGTFDALIEALDWGLAKAMKPAEQVHIDAFVALVRRVRARKYADDADLLEAIEAARRVRKTAWDSLDPRARLDIDWSEVPHAARTLLDRPEDWSESDDFAPHGNDTGADIIADWPEYGHRSPAEIFAEWGFAVPDCPSVTLEWQEWVRVHQALAFGHVRMTGTCPPGLAGEALAVLKQDMAFVETIGHWEQRHAWIERAGRYARILSRLC
jgi:hypothetical protein